MSGKTALSILIRAVLVFAIFAVVAAIVLPNMIDQRGRGSRVSRVKNDQRSMATGIESYFVDYQSYPPGEPLSQFTLNPKALEKANGPNLLVPHALTTPIAYITTYFSDPYSPGKNLPYAYYTHGKSWILFSPGPDLDYDISRPEEVFTSEEDQPSTRVILLAYDPTNGIESSGDVWRVKQ